MSVVKTMTIYSLLYNPQEAPSPLYLKDLYACRKDNTNSTNQDDHDIDKIETNLMVWIFITTITLHSFHLLVVTSLPLTIQVNNMNGHIHIMRLIDFSELDDNANCDICTTKILGSPCKCETCSFQAHNFCAELGRRPLQHRVHNHPLTLLPKAPAGAGVTMICDICTNDIKGFNLFCRLCNLSSIPIAYLKANIYLRSYKEGKKSLKAVKGWLDAFKKSIRWIKLWSQSHIP